MNSTSKGRFGRKAVALITISLVGLVGFAAPASAAVDPYNIDPAKKGSITLTKYSTPDSERTTTEGNGKRNDTAPTPNSVLLNGATFEIFKVNHANLNLTTNEGWQYMESLVSSVGTNPTEAVLRGAPGVSLTSVNTANTGRDGLGVIRWSNLDLGAYYIVEKNVPAGHKSSAPFFVTVPMTDPVELNNWMYDIFVYPKNLADNTVKVPQDKDTHAPGDRLPWDIRTTVPGNATNPLTLMRFEDTLDPALTYNSAEIVIGSVWGAGGNTVLTGAHFTSVYDAPTRKVTVTLTPAGIALLNQHQGESLIVRINTTVNNTYVGSVNNVATVITNKPGSSTETEQVTTPGSISKYGKVTVNKTDTAGASLTGAEFDVYFSHTQNPDFAITNNATTGISKTGVVCKMTSGATSCSDELRFSDFAENVQLNSGDDRWNYYWLVETKAPTGYELLTDPIAFQITKDNTNASFELPTITVKNVKHGGGLQLPFTGGAGSTMFLVAGIALLVGGAVLVTVRSRRRQADAVTTASE